MASVLSQMQTVRQILQWKYCYLQHTLYVRVQIAAVLPYPRLVLVHLAARAFISTSGRYIKASSDALLM